LLSDAKRSRLESAVKTRLGGYGIETENVFVDWEKRTILVLCSHITRRMKIFMSQGNLSLGTMVRDSMVTAHRTTFEGEEFGLVVIYCKECFDAGLRMML